MTIFEFIVNVRKYLTILYNIINNHLITESAAQVLEKLSLLKTGENGVGGSRK